MKTRPHTPAFCLLALFFLQPLMADSSIQLTGRKDLVLSVESRQTVLEVARQHLSEKSSDFLSKIESVDPPFVFEQPVAPPQQPGDPVRAEPEVVTVNYDDASVLQVVAKSFEQQVRGTIARGTNSFLQLKGGNMIKPGTSFPASIPQAQNEKFTVTITEITPNSYTLQLGEAIQTIRLSGSSASSSDNIHLD